MYSYIYIIIYIYINNYTQWCGNSQSCRTLSDKSSECPLN